MKVEQILQSKGVEVYSVSTTATIREAIDVLGEKNIGAVIVNDEQGRVAGILSERDVVRHLRKSGSDALTRRIADCMTPDPVTCTPETELDELMSQMTNRRIRHLPVVKDGELCGVVSIGDVVKRKIETAEQEAAELKQYIAS